MMKTESKHLESVFDIVWYCLILFDDFDLLSSVVQCGPIPRYSKGGWSLTRLVASDGFRPL